MTGERETGDFTYVRRVGWGHCDPAGIAYSAYLPEFALEAIDAWWEDLLDGDGWFQMEMDRKVGTPFVHMSLDFRHPVTPRHRLELTVWPAKLGTRSITFRVDGVQGGTLCYSGTFVCVFTDSATFKSRVAPEEFRQIIAPLVREG